jgi:glycosyltransferase involved in cell wall biosynthesis
VLTRQSGGSLPERAYRLLRQPDSRTIWNISRDADIVVMPNLSLRMVAPIVAAGAPLAIWHQHQYRNPAFSTRGDTLAQRLKGMVFRNYVSVNLGCSDFITRDLPDVRPKATLLNPYDARIMFEDKSIVRDRDLLVLGRLVKEKGFDVVLRAMAVAGGALYDARLSIVGTGPEEAVLRQLAADLGIAGRVDFLGAKTGDELRHVLNQHRVLIVPSVWDEPFGIVALEGLACGAAVVVSNAGGLPEAVGRHGYLFRRGDVGDAAAMIAQARRNFDAGPPDPAGRARHLARQRAENVAAELVTRLAPFARP